MKNLFLIIVLFFTSIFINLQAQAPGNSLNFDGVNDAVGTPLFVPFGGDFTIETWIKTTSTAGRSEIISWGNSSTSNNSVAEFRLASGKLQFLFNGTSGLQYFTSSANVNSGKWTHVAMVKNGTSYTLYVNGVQDGTATIPNNSYVFTNTNIGYLYYAGVSYNDAYFPGSIDEMRIWNAARTQTQIQANMYNEISASSTNLVRYNKFNSTTGTQLVDEVSTANNATLYNFALSGTSSNWVESYAMVVPTAPVASAITNSGFTASWTAPTVGVVTNYVLDVATDSGFTSLVSGYNALNIGSTTTYNVININQGSTYYWRVRADKTSVTGQGNYSATQTTTTVQEAINVTSTTTTNSFNLLSNGAVIVDPNVTVNHSQNITGFSVVISNGKQNLDVLSYTGTLPSGVTATAYNSSTGVLSFTGTTSNDKWQALLRTVTFRAYSNFGTNRSISFSAGSLNSFSNGHYYELVSTTDTWTNSKLAAANKKYLNYTGYLATVTSQAENDYIKQILTANAWMGASDDYSQINMATGASTFANQTASEGNWYWVTGPEAGTNFSTNNSPTTTAVSGRFINWFSGEPNNASSIEHYAQFYSTNNGTWNDYPNAGPLGYVVEYGGLSNDIVQTPSYTVTMSVLGNNPGNALSFDGTDDYVYTSSIVTNPTNFTLEAWFNTTSSLGGGIVGLNNAQSNSSTANFDRMIWIGTDGKLNFGVYNGASNKLTSSLAYNDGKYHHVAASFSSSTGMKLYVDGVLVSSNAGYNSVTAYDGYWKIGGFKNWDNTTYLNGKIDEVRIWNTVRNQTDIQNNMYSVMSPNATDLGFYYSFDQGITAGTNTGNTSLINQTTNGNNAVLSGFALSGTTSNWVESFAMVVPRAATTSAITYNSFTANWNSSSTGSFNNYILDVATNASFTSFLSGFNNKNVGSSTTFTVTGLPENTTYYWRVRADKTSVTGQGGSTTQTVLTLREPINITSTTVYNSFNLLTNSAIIVDPNLVITYSQNINGFRVVINTNKQDGDVLTYTGTLPAGITPVPYNASTGVLAFTGSTSSANWQTFLRTVTFRAYKNSGVTRGISFSAGALNSFSNGHFYEYVAASGMSWSDAKIAAAARSQINYSGYLATVTSADENAFIKQILSADAWMGASDDFSQINMATGTSTFANQTASEGKWYWVTGPEAGTNFSVNNTPTTTSVSGRFSNWASGEPNNGGGSEHYGQFFSSNNALWNDLPNSYPSIAGYIVEYGGLSTDTVQTPSYSVMMYIDATPPGNALSFDGTNDYVYTPTLVTNPTTFTLEAWFNTTSTAGGGIVGLNNAQTNSSTQYDRIIYIGTDGKLNFGVFNGATNKLTSSLAYNDGKYHHVAASFSTSTGMKLYVDGLLVASNAGYNSVTAYNGYWKIGGFNSWDGTSYLNCKIDEVRIWNTVRSQSDIQNNMYNVIAPTLSGLSYYYNFDQGITAGTNTGNTTLFDQTSNGNNGTLSGFGLSGTTSNWVESYAMVVPKSTSTNAILYNGFTANWSASTVGSFYNYILDVATNAGFTSFVTGFNNKVLGSATSFVVTGLVENTTYYWRVRADKTSVTGQGGYTTQTVLTAKEPINITSTTTTNSFNLLTNSAIIVDPNLAINYSQNINGFRVVINTNKQDGDILAYTGTLPSGITPVAYNASTGVLAFTGTTSSANWETFLRTVTFRAYKNSGVARGISFSAGALNSFSNGHFYEYVPASNISWTDAKIAAAARTQINYSGYLATVTSADENAFIKQILSADAWMGASDDYSQINMATGTTTYANQGASEGKWYWVTGPEAGTNFCSSNTPAVPVSGRFNNWATGEPNNSGNNEHYGQFYSSNNALWNDLSNTQAISGYIVEYGGLSTDIVQTPSYALTMNVLASEPGNALNFNGTSSSVTIPDANSLDLTSNYTIEAWIKPESFTSLGGIVSKYQSPSGSGYFLRLTGNSPYNGISFDEMTTANGVLTANKWYHIAAVNSNGTRTLYINGVIVPLTGTAGTVIANSDPIRIGCDYSNRFFNGNIDEVRIWNVARNQSQIVANMNGPISPTTANLVSYYNFNEGITNGANTGLTTLYDQTSSLNNGTLINFNLSAGTVTNWVESYAMVVPTTTAATSKYSLGFTANWTAPSNGTTDKYFLDVATDAAFTSFVSGYSNKDVGTVTSFAVNTGLSANTTYYYRVRAEKASVTGTGANSNTTSVTTNTIETLVANAASNRTSVSFTANWSAPAVHNISAYLLDVSTVSNFATFVSGYNGLSVTGLSQSVTGLSANTQYFYRIRVSGYNNSNTIATSTNAPFGNIATSAISVCLNGTQPTITFTGSGSVAPYTFTYTINGGSNQTVTTASGNSVTVSVPTTTSGVFTYSLVSVTDASSGTNSQTGSVMVTVHDLPVPTFSSATAAAICSSINTTYTTQSGQTNYSWSVPGTLNTDYTVSSGGVGTGSSTVTLKWLTSGSKTVTVNYTSSAGCTNNSPASTTTSVAITPTVAAITGTTTSTVGLSTSLSNTTVGGVWSSSNAAIASINSSGVVTAVGQGTATITYTVTAGSCSDFVTTTYTVNAAPSPTITAVSPTNPVVGATITVTGTNFSGASLVTVGTYQVAFTVVSATAITFALPSGTGTNLAVAVTTPGGTATSSSPNLITYNTAGVPTITSFTPTSAGSGQTVVITGTNLTNPTTITFGGTDVASYTVNSATQITVVIGSGTSGTVVVTTANPTPASKTGFTYLTCSGNPTLYAGGSMTICASQNPLNITTEANASNYSALLWTTSGSGTFANNTTANALTTTTYSPSAADISSGSVRLTLTATANSGCLDASSSKVLNLNAVTVAGSISPANANVCFGSTSGLLTLTGHSGNIVRWESTVSPFTTWTTIANTTSTYTSGVLTETTKFRAVINNNSCGEENATPATISIKTSTYDGVSWSNGTPDSSTTVIFTGNYTINSNFNACSIRVANNTAVTVNSTNNVYLNGAITVESGSSFTMNNSTNLLQSDATAVNTGNIVVKRNTSLIRRLDHTLWSSPVTGQNLLSFSPNTLVNRFYVYNTETNSYVNTGLSNTSLFTPAKGFAVRAPNNQSDVTSAEWTGTFTGVPNNGTKYFTLATNASNTFNYNLVGNPYPSTINATDFYNANSTKIGGTLYFYAHTLTMNANGLFPTGTNYATWTGLGGTAATLGDGQTPAEIPNGIIQVGQGFIVKAIAAGDVTFTNAMRVANLANQFMRTSSTPETHRMWLNLKSDTGVDINQILVGYIDGATQGVDANLDGLSFGNTGSYLYSKIENNNYVIQARSLPFDVTDEVALGFNCATAGSYKIKLTNTDGLFAGTQDVLVRDLLTGTDTSIKTTPYTFTSEAGVFDNRFKLVYTQALGIPTTSFTDNSVIVYRNTDWFHVTTKGIEMKDIMVYDISGRLIYNQKDINATTTVLNGLTTSKQVLLLKIISKEGSTVTIKVIN